MAQTFAIKRNDTRPSLVATLLDENNVAIDLTNATAVQFHMKLKGSLDPAKVDAAAVVVDAALGKVRYDWLAANTDADGTYNAEFEVTFLDGTIQTFPSTTYIEVTVHSDLA